MEKQLSKQPVNSRIELLRKQIHPDASIHLVGTGGAGMRGLARVLMEEAGELSGCDKEAGRAREVRRELGLKIWESHGRDHLNHPDGNPVDLVIHSAALPDQHEELQTARQLDIPTCTYAEALSALFNDRSGIAVAGTHGKTTCSAMLSSLLIETDLDPTCVVGGELTAWSSNAHAGSGNLFVAEACEAMENFQAMNPTHLLVTNIDPDHLDHYEDANAIQQAFGRLLASQDPEGFLVWHEEEETVRDIVSQSPAASQSISTDEQEGDWFLDVDSSTRPQTIQLTSEEDASPRLPLPAPGRHQARNTAQVAVLSRLLGAEWEAIHQGLREFKGIKRRFERVSTEDPVIIDDYGHHPREISETLTAIREAYPDHELIVIFQPHQFNRTHQFMDQWADALRKADQLCLVPIYEARDREEDKERVSIDDVAREVRRQRDDVHRVGSPEEAGEWMQSRDPSGTVFLTLGAGDVWKALDVYQNSS